MVRKEKLTKKPFQIKVAPKSTAFARNMFFNRFLVEGLDGHFLIHFGLVSTGETLSEYSVVLEKQAVNQTRADVLEFLGKLGTISDEEPPKWRPSKRERDIDVSNMILVAHSGGMGEFRFGLYSVGKAVELHTASGTDITMLGQSLALLRCDYELLKKLLAEIFQETTA